MPLSTSSKNKGNTLAIRANLEFNVQPSDSQGGGLGREVINTHNYLRGYSKQGKYLS